jgi:lauroyl/myristoyl acyltransferase
MTETGRPPVPRDEGLAPAPQDDLVRDVRPLVRLYASKHTHRLLPAPVALVIVAALAPIGGRQRRADERRQSERFMKDLLLYTPRAGEAHALTRRYIAERARMNELVWRPWLLKRSRLIGGEHWEAAHRGGRGCVVVIGHMTATFAVPAVLARHGLTARLLISPHYWQPMPPGFVGLAVLHLRREYAEKPLGRERVIPSDTDPALLVDLVERGESVVMAFDVPGSAATPFLGRSVALSGGPATLAFRTKAPVLPLLPERHGSRIDVRLFEPLDPTDYRDARSLRAAIARTFEQLVLAKPEIVELPWVPSPLVTEALSTLRDEDALRGASA